MTRCSSEKEFIERFATFATETDVIVPALPYVSVGTAAPFSISLKDQSVVMKGRCEITEIRPVAGGASAKETSRRPMLMRMRLREMDAHSCGIHLRMMERRGSSSGSADGSGTGAGSTLPANPLADVDGADLASFVEHALPETTDVIDTAPIRRRRSVARAVRGAAPYAVCALAPLFLAIIFKQGAKPAPAVRAPQVVAPPAVASAAAPAPTPEPETAPPRECVARVTTTPTGAAVLWGDIALGSTPIEHAAVPCGTAVVTLQRERYAEVTRTITSEHGWSTVVAERLSRPPAKLVVTSTPANARIKLNKRSLGRTPREVNTVRFERVRIEASAPGYKPWKKTLFLKEEESTVDVKLVRRSSTAAPKHLATAQTGPSAR